MVLMVLVLRLARLFPGRLRENAVTLLPELSLLRVRACSTVLY